ncbi:hypothetical protein [Nocardioides piscis]|uniref:Uncharacterized protein n=1 Tax=Nocardioides piscis TaxID=2714938 RepID=A0A6G7YJH6_9ACTN|nr:hypothetical protein [Nocardioides piscis]QIK76876.1 hypothetical protein G7071_16995 [Nocardioides piscis]
MSDGDEAREPDVGTLADEATKLLGALSGWARQHGEGFEDGLSGVGEHVSTAAHNLNEHLATGSAECTVCPLCRAVHTVRHLSPEVKEHLAVAATSLIHAAAGMLETRPARSGRERGEVEHIDLEETDGE